VAAIVLAERTPDGAAEVFDLFGAGIGPCVSEGDCAAGPVARVTGESEDAGDEDEESLNHGDWHDVVEWNRQG